MQVDAIVGKYVTGTYPLIRDLLSKMSQRGFTIEAIWAPDKANGVDIVTNGDFATGDLTGWEIISGSPSVQNDSVTGDNYVSGGAIRQIINAPAYDASKKLYLEFQGNMGTSSPYFYQETADYSKIHFSLFKQSGSDNVYQLAKRRDYNAFFHTLEQDISMPNNDFSTTDVSMWQGGSVYVNNGYLDIPVGDSAYNDIDLSTLGVNSGQKLLVYTIDEQARAEVVLQFLDSGGGIILEHGPLYNEYGEIFTGKIIIPDNAVTLRTVVTQKTVASTGDGLIDSFVYEMHQIDEYVYKTIGDAPSYSIYTANANATNFWRYVLDMENDCSKISIEFNIPSVRNIKLYYAPQQDLSLIDSPGWAEVSFKGVSDSDWATSRSSVKNFLRITWDGEPLTQGFRPMDVNTVYFIPHNSLVSHGNVAFGCNYYNNEFNPLFGSVYTTSSSGYFYWIYFNSFGILVITKVSGTYYNFYAGVFDPFNASEATILDSEVPEGTNVQVQVSDATPFTVGQKVFMVSQNNAYYKTVKILDVDYGANILTLDDTTTGDVPTDINSIKQRFKFGSGDIIGWWPVRGFALTNNVGLVPYITWAQNPPMWNRFVTDDNAKGLLRDLDGNSLPTTYLFYVDNVLADKIFSPILVGVTFTKTGDSRSGTIYVGHSELFYSSNTASDYDVFYTEPYVDSFATGGTSSSLEDTTQSWATDEHKDKVMIVLAGTGYGTIQKIAGNTATTLNFYSNLPFVPDTTTKYIIVDRAYRFLNSFNIREEVV